MTELPPFLQNVVDALQNFVQQSERVLNVTHKPRGQEYKQIASITAIGMAIIGITGFIISMVAFFLRGH